jgi:putative DNA primase/helicase
MSEQSFYESESFEPSSLANDVISEDSAAQAFVEEHGRELRFCHSSGRWYRWNGQIWKQDETHKAFHWARQLARRLSEDFDSDTRKRVGKRSFAGGVESFAQRDPVVAVTIAHWDADPWLRGTPNGTVDLRTGKLRPSDPKEYITKMVQVAPDGSDCPRWKQFLNEATGLNAGLIRFLQQWLGYCLTGSIREHALVFVYGDGGNGKGVFLNVTTKVMGGYATTAAMETFTASKYDKHPTDLAMLRGARLVTASETEQGHAWAEARIKALTGGDRIAARFMRQDFFEYDPQFKLTVIGNHRPVLRNVDEAMRRRINMIPFLLKPPLVDRQLEEKLLLEAPGILQWMIDGCLEAKTIRIKCCRCTPMTRCCGAHFRRRFARTGQLCGIILSRLSRFFPT